jgi:hypothetical protein
MVSRNQRAYDLLGTAEVPLHIAETSTKACWLSWHGEDYRPIKAQPAAICIITNSVMRNSGCEW